MLDEMDYRVASSVLNAADFGVPQLRERAIIIAGRDHTPRLPQATHFCPSDGEVNQQRRWITVREAIGDLPIPPLKSDTLGGGPVSLYLRHQASAYARALQSTDRFPHNHLTRHYQDSVINIIRQMQPGEDWDRASERMRDQYEELIADNGGKGRRRKIVYDNLIKQGLINEAFYKRYYWSAYTRLHWNQSALTITANANFLGSGRFTHPEQDRGITMREAARLQSFDDDFRFVTSIENERKQRIGVGMDMIGEAVPPLLSQAIASEIIQIIDEANAEAEGCSQQDVEAIKTAG
jgi:site-specific DNA-cytosine methylase